MTCKRCSRTVSEDDRFCGGCGAALTDACHQCGRPFRAGAVFCTDCGTAREAPEPATGVAATEDRRPVSVLFVDLVDFTRYAERADPEQVRRLQTGFYRTARQVIGQYGGVVEKYIGDAVMALFGAPVTTETDPQRCVRAGLELARVLADRSELPLRVGIASGEALVNVAEARDGGQGIVAGDVVNTAARIQSLAPAGGVLVCGRTYALTAHAIRYEQRPPERLRGRTTATEVWLALAPLQHRPGATSDPVPVVDREHELELLAGALRRVVADRAPQLVTLFGQAGVGKSRLVRELRRHAEQVAGSPVVWHTGYCPPFGQDITYAALADIVKAHAGILDTDSIAAAWDRLGLAVRGLASGPAADRLRDALGPLVGLPGPVLPAEEAASAWRRFLVGLAERGPTVLVLEDLHWADQEMLRFIELLAATARDVPLLVLATARPELADRGAGWAGTITGSLTITLPPLRDADMATLYRHLLAQEEELDQRLPRLVELANGNPLYAQEYVRMLVQRRQPGGPVTGPDELPMPDNVHAVIANRVDLLEPSDRAVLQAAAVVGEVFWPGAVTAALRRPAGAVERSLRRLEQREFIVERRESSMAGEGEFRFRHVLVRDVCYVRLPRTERVARHQRAADWLEGRSERRGSATPGTHPPSDLAEVLAHHRWAAHEIARTVDLPAARYAPAARQALYLAARRAYALHALDAAATHLARALSLAEPAAEPERLPIERLATEIAFYQDRAGFLAAGGTDRLLRLAARLTEAAAGPELGPAARSARGPGSHAPMRVGHPESAGPDLAAEAARAWTVLGQAAWVRADREAALAYLGRSVALFGPLPDSPEKLDAYAEQGRLHMLNYECEPAMAAAGTAAAIAGRLGLLDAQANAGITIATARYESGDPAGRSELRELTERCRTHRLLALRRATHNLAHVEREEGDWRSSQRLLGESRRLDGPGAHNIAPAESDDLMWAYFTGDLDALASGRGPAGGWEDGRELRACVRALRDDPAADADAAAALAAARGTGFHRPLWAALAAAALCQGLQGHRAQAAERLAELVGEWQKVPVIASGEWVSKAAHAAALVGLAAGRGAAGESAAAPVDLAGGHGAAGESTAALVGLAGGRDPAGESTAPAEALRVPLSELRRHTAWSEAALQTVTGAVAAGGGDPATGGRHHLAAAEIYRRVPAVTDRMLALALAAVTLARAGEPDLAGPALAEVREFARDRVAPRLLRIAETGLS